MELNIVLLFLLFLFAVVLLSGKQYEKNQNEKYKLQLKKNFGKENKRKYRQETFEHLKAVTEENKNEFYLDDLSWNDLNMNEIFSRLNYSKTTAGDEYLYYCLRNPGRTEEENAKLEERIAYYRDHAEERGGIQLALHKMGYSGKYSVSEDLKDLKKLGKQSNGKIYLSYLILLMAVILSIVKIQFGLPLIFAVLVYNLVSYFKEKRKIEPYIVCFSYILRSLKEISELENLHPGGFREEMEELSGIKKELKKFSRCSFLLMSSGKSSGSPIDIMLDYLRMFFHLDLLKFHSMYEEVLKKEDKIRRMLRLIGSMDATISILEFREYLGSWCIPEFGKNCYTAAGMYHPLLKNPVKNDIDLKKSLLITGSNASGKSTCLKMVAVNAILAQAVHTVCADSYRADKYRVFTSLACMDNIFSGDSFYMAEIKAIKHIMDEAKKPELSSPVLIFVDEVLRGTNTVERIAASAAILKELSTLNGYCLAATHDRELTELLKDYYENVHFEEEIREGDIYFPYRLMKGKSTTRNAIALLGMMNYDKKLVEEANEQARIFELEGKWKLAE